MRYGVGSMSVFAGRGICRTLLISLLGLAAAGSTSASAGGPHAAMVIDANTGAVLMSESGDEARFPASLTKMMTLYMVFEQIEAGRLTMETKLRVSREAAAAKPSKLDLEPGEEIAVGDAVRALITKSANDASIVLAEGVGGTHGNFATLMTAKARSLGMTRTAFRNANGLPDSAQTTTARDMLTLGIRLQDDFPKYYPLFALQSFTFNGQSHRNHNKMLGKFEGIDGIKTGYTHASGFNIVTSVRQGGKHVVGVVFGGSTAGSRDATMRVALTRSLLKASPVKTRKPAGPQLVASARKDTVTAAAPAMSLGAPARTGTTPAQAAALAVVKVRPVMVASRPRAPDAPAAGVTSVPGRGAAPSTLQAQARTLSGEPETSPAISAATGEPARKAKPVSMQAGAPPYRLGAAVPADDEVALQPVTAVVPAAEPAPAPPAPAAASADVPRSPGFHVQIGAYATAAESSNVLLATKAKAAATLAGSVMLTTPVAKENRTLYRARFTGFNAQAAARACQDLRRQNIDCFVMKAE
jgi:D-alanyl-D-alanine carboxypeptidase